MRSTIGAVTMALATALAAATATASPAAAQDYPNRPITLVIPLPPGGTNDMMARAVADKLGAALGQQVVIENRPAGGSGTVATRQVARGPADGYTLLLGYTSTLATGPHMFPNVGYDVRKDFAPIGLIAMSPALILVHPSVTYRGVADLIADMRASKEPFQVGTPGVSTVNHLSALLFAQQAGVKLQYIPYKGSGPLNTELIGGFVKVGFNPIPVSRGAIEGKLIRALAATSLKREKLNKVLRDALATDEVKRRLAQESAEPMPTTPEEHAAILDREDTKWAAIIKSAGIHEK